MELTLPERPESWNFYGDAEMASDDTEIHINNVNSCIRACIYWLQRKVAQAGLNTMYET